MIVFAATTVVLLRGDQFVDKHQVVMFTKDRVYTLAHRAPQSIKSCHICIL